MDAQKEPNTERSWVCKYAWKMCSSLRTESIWVKAGPHPRQKQRLRSMVRRADVPCKWANLIRGAASQANLLQSPGCRGDFRLNFLPEFRTQLRLLVQSLLRFPSLAIPWLDSDLACKRLVQGHCHVYFLRWSPSPLMMGRLLNHSKAFLRGLTISFYELLENSFRKASGLAPGYVTRMLLSDRGQRSENARAKNGLERVPEALLVGYLPNAMMKEMGQTQAEWASCFTPLQEFEDVVNLVVGDVLINDKCIVSSMTPFNTFWGQSSQSIDLHWFSLIR